MTDTATSRYLFVYCITVLVMLFVNIAQAQDVALPGLNYIFKPGDDNYACFRIPAIINTKKNNLLAFAEGRRNSCGDSGDIDLVLRRSADGGKTWTDLQVVWSDSTNTCGNPVPVQDASDGKIWLMCSWNAGTEHEEAIRSQSSQYGRRVFVLSSADEGRTWSGPTELTQQVKKPDWTWYATGPCHGVQLSAGKYKGRLVVPVNHVEAASKKNFAHIIYSDDHGATWHLGGDTPQDGANETTVAEINNGNLMLNIRNADRKKKARLVTTSADGGQTWANLHADRILTEPVCQGSLLNFKLSKNKMGLFFSDPADTKKRMNLTLRLSLDEGKTWVTSTVLYPGPSAYSDLATDHNKNIDCLFEAGVTTPYDGIVFKIIPIKDLIK